MKFYSLALPLRDLFSYYLNSSQQALNKNKKGKLQYLGHIYLSNFMGFFFTYLIRNFPIFLPNKIFNWRKDSQTVRRRSNQRKIKKYYKDYGINILGVYGKILEYRRPGGLAFFLHFLLKNSIIVSIFDTVGYLLPSQDIIYRILKPIFATILGYFACYATLPFYNLSVLKRETYKQFIYDKIQITSKKYRDLMIQQTPKSWSGRQINLIRKPSMLQVFRICLAVAVYQQLTLFSKTNTNSQ